MSQPKVEEVSLVFNSKVRANDRILIRSPEDAYRVLRRTWNEGELGVIEEFKIMLLDRGGRLMSLASVSKGGMTGTVVDPRVVFTIALKRRAHRMILAHNHPSGTLRPSEEDLRLTRRLQKIGKLMCIDVDDHIIVTKEGYVSISNEGLMENVQSLQF